jgi:hypothetical protein
MHVFERYGHPLRIARIRQYLHEGAERWHMLAIAEAVPGLVHIALFLFLFGLADLLLHSCAIVGAITVLPIGLCAITAMLYIIGTVVPLASPQSPYRTSFTGLAWFITQKLFNRRCKDRFGVDQVTLNSNMADGQMQLAMAKNDTRKGRDERAIRWLVGNLTEDIEMESLVSGIPGSFDAKWGVEVWKKGSEIKKDDSTASSSTGPPTVPPNDTDSAPSRLRDPLRQSTLINLRNYIRTLFKPSKPGDFPPPIDPPTIPSVQTNTDVILQPPRHLPVGGEIVHDLCQRIRRLFETCDHRGSFVDEDEWRRRSRGCVETAASFVFCMDAGISSFGEIGDVGKLLSDLGSAEGTRDVSASSLNRTFTTRWTCLSLVAVRKMMNSSEIARYASGTMQALGTLSPGNGSTTFEAALRSSRWIDEQFAAAWDCVERLRQAFNALGEGRKRVESVEEVLRRYSPRLEDIQGEAERMKLVDKADKRISVLQDQIDQVTHKLTRQFPGVAFDYLTESTPIGQIFEFLANPVRPQLLYLSQRLLGLCSLSQKRSSRGYLDIPDLLRGVEKIPPALRSVPRRHHLMERQLWRLDDLSRGGAFGFTLELYFLSLRQILSTFTGKSLPRGVDTSFYVGAFKAITSDWEQVKGSLGTLQIVLNIVCDIAIRDRGIFSNSYPDYINKELLDLLEKMVEGQAIEAIPYIRSALDELRNVGWRTGDDEGFLESALKIIQEQCEPSGSS